MKYWRLVIVQSDAGFVGYGHDVYIDELMANLMAYRLKSEKVNFYSEMIKADVSDIEDGVIYDKRRYSVYKDTRDDVLARDAICKLTNEERRVLGLPHRKRRRIARGSLPI